MNNGHSAPNLADGIFGITFLGSFGKVKIITPTKSINERIIE